MPKQTSIIKLEGTIDDINFFRTAEGYRARKAARISPEVMATSPGYQRVRENMAEFSRAGKGGRVVRYAFSNLLTHAKGKRVIARLHKEVMKVIKADVVNPRGQRTVTDGNLGFLQGFEFNNGASLRETLAVQYTTTIDRAAGTARVDLPALVPTESIKAPAGATHYRLVCAGAEIDFDTEAYKTDVKESIYLPLTATPAAALSLTATVPAASTHKLLMVLGLQFFQEVNGLYYALKSGEHNALSIVKVDG